MAPPTDPTLADIEDAMRTAFFVFDHDQIADKAELPDDPPISIPDISLVFESLVHRHEGRIKRELSSKYPNLFQDLDTLPTGDVDPFKSLFRQPETRKNFIQNITSWNTSIQARNLESAKFLQEVFARYGQTEHAQQSDETMEQLESIQRSLAKFTDSVSYIQSETSSSLRLLDVLGDLVYGDKIPRAFDPSLDHSERMKRVKSILDNMRTVLPDMKLNVSGIPPAQDFFDARPIMGHLDSSYSTMQGIAADYVKKSRMPDLSSLEDFHYKQLSTETSIRLLRFEQESESTQPNLIKLSFHIVNLNNRPEFNALSYVWGDHRPALNQRFNPKRSQRLLHIVCDGRKLAVTYNLFCALKRLSGSSDGTLGEIRNQSIWIDQLCINQQDVQERNQQVAMMDRIYGQAKQVVSWLGEEDRFTDKAVQLLDILADIPSEEYRSPNYQVVPLVQNIPSENWLALGTLLSRSYFRRAWIVQEIALADSIVLVCGKRIISWENLDKCSRFLQDTRAWTLLTKHAAVFRSMDEHIKADRWRPPIRFGHQVSTLLDARDTIRLNKLLPEDLLLLGRQFDCSDVKDKFYAMLGLAKVRLEGSAQHDGLPPAKYECSLDEIAVSFVSYHIGHSGGLQILSFVEDGIHRINKGLPSWVPDPAAPLLPRPLVMENASANGSSPWNPCGSNISMNSFVIHGNILTAEGCRIDVIKRTATPFNVIVENGQWSDVFELLEHLKEKLISGNTFDQFFLKTLIASADPAHGKCAAQTEDLQPEFCEWLISLINSPTMGGIAIVGESHTAQVISSLSRSDEMMFNALTFGKEAGDVMGINPHNRPDPVTSVLERWQLPLDALNKLAGDRKPDAQQQSRNVSKRLEDTIIRLWESNRDGAFPNPAHIQETLSTLRKFKEDSSGRSQIQERIDRFKAALGTKLDSRRIFTTVEDRLGMGPHSLEEGDEVWVLKGAKVPFVLRKLGNGNFVLIGEAFIFGAMHGEAVKNMGIDAFSKIMLE